MPKNPIDFTSANILLHLPQFHWDNLPILASQEQFWGYLNSPYRHYLDWLESNSFSYSFSHWPLGWLLPVTRMDWHSQLVSFKSKNCHRWLQWLGPRSCREPAPHSQVGYICVEITGCNVMVEPYYMKLYYKGKWPIPVGRRGCGYMEMELTCLEFLWHGEALGISIVK